MFPLPNDIKMKENQGGLKFIFLRQFFLYTVGAISKGMP
jgi:hypothetical protein